MPEQRFDGIDRLYGLGSVAHLHRMHVCVIGIGGVGSWVVEALARSGIGALTLVDADEVCISNTNRQLHALEGEYGRSKVDVVAERARAINPQVRVHPLARFLTPSSLETILGDGFDLVIDCCDAFRVKVETIAWCKRRKQPLLICGAAGGRTDPTQVRVRDLAKTEQDTFLAMIRRKLRDEFRFPRDRKRYFGVAAVYSLENVRYPQADGRVCGIRPAGYGAARLDCGSGLGAATHVTGAFAFAAVARAIEMLLAAAPRQNAMAEPELVCAGAA